MVFIISASGGSMVFQMVSEPNTGQCVSLLGGGGGEGGKYKTVC